MILLAQETPREHPGPAVSGVEFNDDTEEAVPEIIAAGTFESAVTDGSRRLSSGEKVLVALRVALQEVGEAHRRVARQLADRVAYHVQLAGRYGRV